MTRRRVSITTKLAGALAVPLAALSLVAGLEVGQSVRDAREVARQTDLATAAIGPGGLITAVQNERNFTGLWLLGSDGVVTLPVTSLEQARAETDAARKALTEELERKGGVAARIYTPAMNRLSELQRLRADVDAYDGVREVSEFNETANNSFTNYTELVSALSDRNSILSTEIEDEQLRRGVELIDKTGRGIDNTSRLVRLSLLTATTGDRRLTGADEIARAGDLVDAGLVNHQQMLDLATGPYGPAGQNMKVETDATGLLEMGPKLIRTGNVDVPALLRGVSNSKDESYYGFLRDVSKIVQDRADELNTAAQTRSRWYLGLAALVMLAAVGAILVVSRSIVRPLKDLTRQSIAMAERHLPAAVRSVLETPVGEDVVVPDIEPVSVHSSDEVAAVAETLNTVQSAAVTLAVDQALLRRNVADAFINLARRNQNLLSRQLDFITDLERDETRTDQLDNLFRLDHLATRMRRNAESLLVLAGAEASRQWSGPVRLHDVVRAALGEVEDYQRVVLHDLEGATVLGSAASDLAHLLAELIENALRFSPPDKDVEVSGRSRAGSYLLLVSDDGLGMTEEDIAAANERLSRNEMFSLASPRYLGHYVAGNLAARHGIGVQLYRSACSGITVAVELPAPLLSPSLELQLEGGPIAAGAITGATPAIGVTSDRARTPDHRPLAAAPFVPVPADGDYDAGRGNGHGPGDRVTGGRRGNGRDAAGTTGAPGNGRTANGFDNGFGNRLDARGPADNGFDNGFGNRLDLHGPVGNDFGFGFGDRGGGRRPGNGRGDQANGHAGSGFDTGHGLAGPGQVPPAFAAGPPPLPTRPPGAAPAGPPPGMVPGLARRIPGAQMPRTAVRGLRRSPDPAAAAPAPVAPAPAAPVAAAPAPVRPTPAAPPPAPGSPDDVYRVISEYVAGLDRGRGAADEHPTPTGGP